MLRMTTLWACIVLINAAALIGFTANAAQNAGLYKSAKRFNLGGQLTGIISPDPDGQTGPLNYPATRNTYNTQGLLVKVETGFLLSWQNELVAPANWTGFTVSREQSFTYDGINRKLSELTSSVNTSNQTERVLKQFSYDGLDRVICEAQRMNPAVFDDLINTAATTGNACVLGPEGDKGPDRISRYTYHHSLYEKIIKIERGVGTALQQAYAQYTYNTLGERTSVVDANNNFSKLDYDGFGRLEYLYFPSKTTGALQHNASDFEKYTYDNVGNRTQLRKRDGAVINYEFDKLNQLIKKDIPNSTDLDVYTGYDLRGLQVYARYASRSPSADGITREYDGFGRMESDSTRIDGVTRTIQNQFNANGDRIRITHPDGQFFDYHYDGLSRLVEISENGSSALTTHNYDNFSRPTKVKRANTSETNLNYDPISRIESMNEDLAGIGFDLNQQFAYNAANQVITQDLHNNRYHYRGDGGETGNYEVNGLNQYTSVDGQNITYDANGNLTSDGTTQYQYDFENRLLSATGLNNATLSYDPLGRLQRVSSGNQKTDFIYDGVFLIAEYGQADTLKHRYVHGLGMDAPLVEYQGDAVTSDNRTFLHTNYLGSVIAGSDQRGVASFANTYNQYGVPGGANVGRFGYTGQIYLPELQLYHYKARIYSPYIGRFFQTDPVGFADDVNLYAYVGNDPMNSNDPTGKFLNFVAKFAVDVALTVAIQVATGEPVDVGAAVKDAAEGVVNPAKTVKKLGRLGRALSSSKGATRNTTNSKTPSTSNSDRCSFTPETKILTNKGYKSIIEVEIGDIVLSKNDSTGLVAWRKVTNTFKDWHEETITFSVIDENGIEESITTTTEHPFYVDNVGWLEAGSITLGSVVSGPKSENDISIIGITVNEEAQYAYNLTVDTDHTYFVGKTNMWVHNSCDPTDVAEGAKPGTYRPSRELPRKNGHPVGDSDAPHTQLGTKKGSKGDYTQAREFDGDGNVVRDIDFTDHGRPQNHPNPHQHRYVPNETGGTRKRLKKAEPLDY